ncbi:MAG: hypothetical protein K8R76_02560 [Candidatus Aegiribacteria sp.]|nr:hypothetical protein [Candidatus Aegiribacteria sp.]
MHFLLMALIGITTTQPPLVDQAGDGSWTAPGYRIVEEVTINPIDYGEPIGWYGDQAQIACQMFFVPTDEGEKWRIVILFSNKVVVLQEDEEIREIPLYCTPYGAIFSRGGRYVLVLGNAENRWYDELINLDTGDVQPYLFRDESGWSGYIYVCDDGSTVRSSYGDMYRSNPGEIELIDSDLNISRSWIDTTSGTWQDTRNPAHLHNSAGLVVAADGSLKVMTFLNRSTHESRITAFNGEGDILWETSDYRGAAFVTSDGLYVVFYDGSTFYTVDGFTCELLNRYELEDRLNASTCSRTGHSWAFQLYGQRGHYEEGQRYDGRRGLAWVTDPTDSDGLNILTYISDDWDHINPYRVSSSGNTIGTATARPSSGNNYDILKFVYVNNDGNILYVSPIVNLNIGESIYQIASKNFNHEHELGSIPSALQSDGNRFGFYDGKTLKYFRIEGSNI